MKKIQIKKTTIARISSLIVAFVNQSLAIFGRGVLPFTENMAYQVVSFAFTAILVVVNAWYNNDISKVALLCGGVFDALSDGKITEEEIEKMLADAEDPEKAEEAKKGNFIVNFINGIIEKIKTKKE